MAKYFYLWQVSERCTVELCQWLVVKPARHLWDKTATPLQLTCTAVLTRNNAFTLPRPALFCFTKGTRCLKCCALGDRCTTKGGITTFRSSYLLLLQYYSIMYYSIRCISLPLLQTAQTQPLAYTMAPLDQWSDIGKTSCEIHLPKWTV